MQPNTNTMQYFLYLYSLLSVFFVIVLYSSICCITELRRTRIQKLTKYKKYKNTKNTKNTKIIQKLTNIHKIQKYIYTIQHINIYTEKYTYKL